MAEHDIMRTAKRVNVKERRPSAQDSLSTIYSTSPPIMCITFKLDRKQVSGVEFLLKI